MEPLWTPERMGRQELVGSAEPVRPPELLQATAIAKRAALGASKQQCYDTMRSRLLGRPMPWIAPASDTGRRESGKFALSSLCEWSDVAASRSQPMSELRASLEQCKETGSRQRNRSHVRSTDARRGPSGPRAFATASWHHNGAKTRRVCVAIRPAEVVGLPSRNQRAAQQSAACK